MAARRSDESRAFELLKLKQQDREVLRVEHRLSIDYLKNRQVADVEQQLLERFEASQLGKGGQEIYPVTIPLTERYVAEAANAYNGFVRRYLVDSEGAKSDATRRQTDKLLRALERMRYDERLHAVERYTVLLRLCCLWFQVKRRQVRPVVVFPYQVSPVLPENAVNIDPADPDDYLGFVIEQEWDREAPLTAKSARRYAYVKRDGTLFYESTEPGRVGDVLGRQPNVFEWEQTDDDGTKRRPGRTLTFWHESLNVDELIPMADATIARANRELNVSWSVLLDTIRFQSYSTPVMKLTNADSPVAKRRHGARFPVVLDITEDYDYATAAAPYSQTVEALSHFARFMAAMKRQSPNDFSIEGAKAISGFAKKVDSLPKIEQRHERIVVLKYLEEHEAGPPLIAGLVSTGELDAEARQMSLRTQFGDMEFPDTADEQDKRISVRIKHNLTTPVEILAKETGMSLKEAEERIRENARINKELGGSARPAGDDDEPGDLSRRVAGAGRQPPGQGGQPPAPGAAGQGPGAERGASGAAPGEPADDGAE